MTGGFPSQKASDEEIICMQWRRHGNRQIWNIDPRVKQVTALNNAETITHTGDVHPGMHENNSVISETRMHWKRKQ